MTQGTVAPLSLERFRICEFYAELLHCSNMGLLNRKAGEGPQYDDLGRLIPSDNAIEVLQNALTNPPSGADQSANTLGPGSDATSGYDSPNAFTDESFHLPAGMEDISLDSPAQSPVQTRPRVFAAHAPAEHAKDVSSDDSHSMADLPGTSELPTAGHVLKTKMLEEKVASVLIVRDTLYNIRFI